MARQQGWQFQARLARQGRHHGNARRVERCGVGGMERTMHGPDDPLYKSLGSFQQNVAKRSNGALEIKLFPSSQLGKDEDVLEQARAGGRGALSPAGVLLTPASVSRWPISRWPTGECA